MHGPYTDEQARDQMTRRLAAAQAMVETYADIGEPPADVVRLTGMQFQAVLQGYGVSPDSLVDSSTVLAALAALHATKLTTGLPLSSVWAAAAATMCEAHQAAMEAKRS